MSPLVYKALAEITSRTNLSTGLVHPNDKNAAKELFKRLHDAGFALDDGAVSTWAKSNGWRAKDADELGSIAGRIGAGKRVVIKDGPWWSENILDILSRE